MTLRALKKEFDKNALKWLVPISALSPARFEQLVAHTEIEQMGSGGILFKEGDTDPRAVYLLSGKVVLKQGKSVVDTVTGGSEQSRYPLAHHNPRQLTAIAKSRLVFVRIDTAMLDALLGQTGNASAYEVSEVEEDADSGDWMSQLLQSDTLKHLPVESIQSMLLRLEEIAVKDGDIILREGELGDYYYILRKGTASVSVSVPNSDEPQLVAQLHPGDPFGEEALIIDNTRNATITMDTDGIVMRLSKEDFDELMKTPLINWLSRSEADRMATEGATWLDVRMPDEVQQGKILGSLNVPLGSLRSEIAELDASKTYICYCDSGRRSSVAAFLLAQRGLTAYVLHGGYQPKPEVPTKAATDTPVSAVPTQPDNVITLNVEQEAVRQRAFEEEVEARMQQEKEKRAEMEAELAQLRAEQAMTAELAQNEVNRREEAEAEKARVEQEAQRLQRQSEAAQRQAEHESQRRAEAEAEAQEAKLKAKEAMERAVDEARKIKIEREEIQRQTDAKLAELQDEREAVRIAAEAEAKRLHDEADAARSRLEEEAEQLRNEREEARKNARESAEKLQQEQEQLQKEADEAAAKMLQELESAREEARNEAERLKQEADEARRLAEEDARKRSEALATEVAEAEQKRLRAEQQAQQLLDEAEAARLQAQAETAALEARQAEARLNAEEELARLQAESDAARQRAEEEARKQQQAEQSRVEAQQQAEQAQKEAELVRKQAAEEAALLQAEAEKVRLEAEEQATKALSEAEQSCLKAKEEATRLEAQAEEARASLETMDSQQLEQVQQLEEEARAAREAAEVAMQHKQQAETAKQTAEAEAQRLKQEAEVARQQAEQEAANLIDEAEKTRLAAEQEATSIRENAESAREAAETMALEVNREAEEKRREIEAEAERVRLEALETRDRAEAVSQKLRDEAEQLARVDDEQTESVTSDRMDDIPELSDVLDANMEPDTPEQDDDIAAKLIIPDEPEDSLLEDANAAAEVVDELDRLLEDLPQQDADDDIDDDTPLQIPEMDIDTDDEEDDEELLKSKEISKVDTSTAKASAQSADLDLDEMELLAAAVESELAETVKDLGEDSQQIELGNAFKEVEPAPHQRQVAQAIEPVDDIEVDVELDEISQLIDEAGDKYDDSVLHETVFTDQLPERKRNYKPLIIGAVSVLSLAVVGLLSWIVLTSESEPELLTASNNVPQPPVTAVTPQPAQPPVAIPSEQTAKATQPVAPTPAPVTPVKPEPEAKATPEPAPPVQQQEPEFVPPTPYRDSLNNGTLGPALVNLPGGTFTMGSPNTSLNFNERPPRKVTMAPFAISQFEITVAQYQRYLRATNKGNLTAAELGGSERQPVAKVSWLDARDYARWLSQQTGQRYRLPSEAEWEYATDAGTNNNYWWGANMEQGRANCFNCGSQWDASSSAPVGSFEPNRFQLYDMAGNIAEWVADCRHGNYRGAPTDGSAWLTGDCDTRMVRGGAFNSPSDSLRTRNRAQYPIDSRLDNIGFRLVRELK